VTVTVKNKAFVHMKAGMDTNLPTWTCSGPRSAPGRTTSCHVSKPSAGKRPPWH